MKIKRWIQVTVPCEISAFEAVSNHMFEQGAVGVEEQENQIVGYFNESLDIQAFDFRIASHIDSLKELGFSVGNAEISELPDEDWSVNWREHFHAIPVSNHMVIKPPWETWQGSHSIVIDIMPRMAFGTGSHETTRICLELLEKYIQPGFHVLDVGTGSGILAIAAVKMGAGCTAVEVDGDALENTRENAALNRVSDRMEILHGSLETAPRKNYDLILANINRLVLTGMLPDIADYCHNQTKLILSGILDEERNIIIKAVRHEGMEVLEIRQRGEWIGLAAQRTGF